MIRFTLAIATLCVVAAAYAEAPRVTEAGLVEVAGQRAALAGVEPPETTARRVQWRQLFQLVPWVAEFTDAGVELTWGEHRANKLLVAADAATPLPEAEPLQQLAARSSRQSQNSVSLSIDGLTYRPPISFEYDMANLMLRIDNDPELTCQSQGADPQHPVSSIIALMDGSFLVLANPPVEPDYPDGVVMHYSFTKDLISLVTPRGDHICGTPSALRATMAAPRETIADEPAVFTLKVFNETSDSLDSPAVDIIIPAGVAFVSGAGDGWSCQATATGAACSRPSLAADASHRIDLTLSPADPGDLLLTCTAAMASPGAVNDDGCSAVTDVAEDPDKLFRDRFEALAVALSYWSENL